MSNTFWGVYVPVSAPVIGSKRSSDWPQVKGVLTKSGGPLPVGVNSRSSGSTTGPPAAQMPPFANASWLRPVENALTIVGVAVSMVTIQPTAASK